MPWKNGGGETTEIAVSPEAPGSTISTGASRWRASRPTGRSPALPASTARWPCWKARAFVLEYRRPAPDEADGASAPLSFPADVPTSADLIAGPITDLNVMTRRGRMPRTRRAPADFGARSTSAGEPTTTLIFCADEVACRPGNRRPGPRGRSPDTTRLRRGLDRRSKAILDPHPSGLDLPEQRLTPVAKHDRAPAKSRVSVAASPRKSLNLCALHPRRTGRGRFGIVATDRDSKVSALAGGRKTFG